MLKRGGKKAQGMSTSTIILLVLGIAILVILIFGFTQGWGKIAPWLSKDNADSIKNTCTASSITGGEFEYCSKIQELKSEGETIKTSCAILATVSEFEKYGIEESDFDCIQHCAELEINGNNGEIKEASKKITSCSEITDSDDCNNPLRGCKWISNVCEDVSESQVLKECSEFLNQEDCISVGCDWVDGKCGGGSQSVSTEANAYDVSLLADDLDSGQRCLITK